MSVAKALPAALALCAFPLVTTCRQADNQSEIVDKVVAQEQLEIQLLREYSPLVETYIQYVRLDKELGAVPDGDKYFLGRAKLAKGVELEPLEYDPGIKRKLSEDWREFLNIGFVPGGFLQMIYVDTSGFDRQHYKFEYVRREFLGEVRCLVFDVGPVTKGDKGRFVGRIWVEDQDYHIVRFNGSYGEPFLLSNYFNFDSWRMNIETNQWLPAFIYIEQGNLHDPETKRLAYRPFRAQTRLWGYRLGPALEEQELSKLLIETPMNDSTKTANDYSPVEAQHAWERQAEANVTEHLERQGLLAPRGEVDKVLETVVNNLEVTNGLDLRPEVRCRILMTSTLESFTIGHTIVLSRGLVDVLPDEASLAAILAHELGHVVLGHRLDSQYAFFDQLLVEDKDTFRHFGFARTKDEEEQANAKAMQILNNSPYKTQLSNAGLFLQVLDSRQKEIPNLISGHLGNRVPQIGEVRSTATGDPQQNPQKIAALPIGGRVKIDPWNDHLELLKSKPVGAVAEREKMPFEVTPFMPYLTRYGSGDTSKPANASS